MHSGTDRALVGFFGCNRNCSTVSCNRDVGRLPAFLFDMDEATFGGNLFSLLLAESRYGLLVYGFSFGMHCASRRIALNYTTNDACFPAFVSTYLSGLLDSKRHFSLIGRALSPSGQWFLAFTEWFWTSGILTLGYFRFGSHICDFVVSFRFLWLIVWLQVLGFFLWPFVF